MLALAAWPNLAWSESATPSLETIRVGEQIVQVEIADTPGTRQRGLMGRRSLPQGHGMLFVFEETDVHCFWMKDTPLPLSIAFITAQGRIVSIADMHPYSETAHCPSVPVRYALEMAQGWFSKAGIAPGDGVGPLPSPR